MEEDHRFKENEDLYSGGRKWDTQAAAEAITTSIQKRRLSAATIHATASPGGTGSYNSFSPNSHNYNSYDNDQPLSNNIPFADYSQSMNGESAGADRDGYHSDSGVAPRKSTSNSLMNSLFGQLGAPDQPDVAGEYRDRVAASEYVPDEHGMDGGTGAVGGGGGEEGYTSDPGYSYHNNGSQRLTNMQDTEPHSNTNPNFRSSPVMVMDPHSNPNPSSNSSANPHSFDTKAMSSELLITAESESEKHQIDAYLNWLEKQDATGTGTDGPTVTPSVVLNNYGLDPVEEESWEKKARMEREEQ